jgi:uncharacterized protein
MSGYLQKRRTRENIKTFLMKKPYSSPKVYIREPSYLPHVIEPVPTAIAAIIGSFPKGTMKTPTQVRTWATFEKVYGGLSKDTLSSHCVKQFFDNGGKVLWVIRIGKEKIKGVSPFFQGLSLLDRIENFTLLCIPQTEQLPDAQAATVMEAAITLVAQHRAIYLLDIPRHDAPRNTVPGLATWVHHQPGIRHPNVAIYVPRVQVPQASQRSPLHMIPVSGTMARLLSRLDRHRGVWKSPAGTGALLQSIQGVEQTLTQSEMGRLNTLGINPIRQISPSQFVSWGARTLSPDKEWQYLSVRRLALFLESSMQRGLGWVMFEPNDEPLWEQIRHIIEVFLQKLFRQAIFQGQRPQEAYFVRCGRETISSSDQKAGIVKLMVGFAPLKPAEFIILTIQQKAKSFPA